MSSHVIKRGQQGAARLRAAVTAGKISFVRRWIASFTVLVVAIVATTVIALWRRVDDPRQYPDSDHVTLGSALDWAHLTLPECSELGVKYWYFSNLFGEADLLIRMSATRACVEQFLSANAAEPIAAGDEQPAFVTHTPDAWNWPDGPLLSEYSVTADRPSSVIVEIAADLDAAPLADLFVHVSRSS